MFTNDPLTGQPRIVAEARAARLGPKPEGCPFCPGNEHTTPPEVDRSGGEDWNVRVVPNLYPLGEHHEVIVNTNRHVTTVRDLTEGDWHELAAMWQTRLVHHSKDHHSYAHLFINDGKDAGASLEHSHSQLLVVPRGATTDALTSGVHGADDCVLCRWVIDKDDDLVLVDGTDFIVQMHPTPRISGSLLVFPRTHTHAFVDEDPADLAPVLRSAVRAMPDADFNLWVVTDSTKPTHWYIEFLPRNATPAGVEFGLGYGVATVPLAQSADAAKQRLANVDVH